MSSLQHAGRPLTPVLELRHPEGHARWASEADPRREGSEVGGGAKTAAGSPAAGCVTRFGATLR